MNRYSLIKTLLLTLLPLAASAQQPNILIILADDLGYEALGTYGGTDFSTPELDSMAAQGVRFERAYTSPVCTPTRVSLHTSLYTSDHGHTRVLPVHNGTSDIVDFIAMPTFAQLLRAAGYRTSVTGKWQLATYDKNPTHLSDSGFDFWYIWQIWDDAVNSKTKRYWDGTFNHDGTKLEFTGTSEYGPDLLADYVTDQMMTARDAGEPFLIVHNMLLPHEEDGLYIQTPDDVALARPASLANMIHYMDKLVGQILDSVVALGIRENTYVFFIGDNGTDTETIRNTVDGPVSGGKRDLDDGGTRVPFIVWGPNGIGPGRSVTDLVDITDVFPTVCSLAGVTIPASIPYRGHSLVPQLEGRPGLKRRYVHQGIYDIFDNREREAIFDGEWRLQLDGTLTDGRDPNAETQVSVGNPEGDAVRPRLDYALDFIRSGATGTLVTIIDNTDLSRVTYTGTWKSPESTAQTGYYGTGYTHDLNMDKGTKSARFAHTLTEVGNYMVELRWTELDNRATNVPGTVSVTGQADMPFLVNQQDNGSQWNPIGTFFASSGDIVEVLLETTGTDGYVIADAVRLSKSPDALDIWRRLQFGPDAVNDPAQEATLWGDLLDPDNDGIATIFEYYRGSQPLISDAAGPRPALVKTASDLRLRQVERLNDTRNVLLQEVSGDLTPDSWDPIGTAFEEESRIFLNKEHDEVLYRLKTGASLPAFVRDNATP